MNKGVVNNGLDNYFSQTKTQKIRKGNLKEKEVHNHHMTKWITFVVRTSRSNRRHVTLGLSDQIEDTKERFKRKTWKNK